MVVAEVAAELVLSLAAEEAPEASADVAAPAVAALPSAAAGVVVLLEPPLKSVTYQPEPLS